MLIPIFGLLFFSKSKDLRTQSTLVTQTRCNWNNTSLRLIIKIWSWNAYSQSFDSYKLVSIKTMQLSLESFQLFDMRILTIVLIERFFLIRFECDKNRILMKAAFSLDVLIELLDNLQTCILKSIFCNVYFCIF